MALRRPGPLAAAIGLAAVFVLLAAAGFGPTPRTWRLVPLLGMLALVVVLDLRLRIVPDVLTLPALAYALLLAGLAGLPYLGAALLGGAIAGGVLLVLAVASGGHVGGGDVKLAAVLGAALGWQAGLLVIGGAEALAGLIAVGALVVRRRRPRRLIPVGAAMALLGALALIVLS